MLGNSGLVGVHPLCGVFRLFIRFKEQMCGSVMLSGVGVGPAWRVEEELGEGQRVRLGEVGDSGPYLACSWCLAGGKAQGGLGRRRRAGQQY